MADTQSLSLCDIFRAGSSPALGILSRKRYIIKPVGLTLLRYRTRQRPFFERIESQSGVYLLVKLLMLRHIPRLGLYPKQVIVH